MNAPASNTPFAMANPHALATILEASQTKSIIASRDIFDISGIKLWARDLPVSTALQKKLLDRELKNPLESCLLAEDGVTTQTLLAATEAMLDASTPLSHLLRPHSTRLLQQIPHLPLHSVVQLLLTAGQASRPESFGHALQAMALNGALMIAQGGTTSELRLAMLAGLIHDLGEMYIDPQNGELDAERTLDFISYQQLVVHPHVGELLVAQLTDYPPALARAIGEHHERLDGSGYPHGRTGEDISPMGRLLCTTEAALAVLRGERPYLARMSVALRVVPGEFDLSWVGRIVDAARTQPELHARLEPHEVSTRLARLDRTMTNAQETAASLMASAQTPALKEALTLVQYLLGRLRAGWNASGLWSADCDGGQDAAEVEAIEDELFHRLHAIERAAMLRAGELPVHDAGRLSLMCDTLKDVWL